MTKKSIVPIFLVALILISILSQLPLSNAQSSFSVWTIGQTETTISLEWNEVNVYASNGYTLYYSSQGTNGPFQSIEINSPTTSTYPLTYLNPGTNYWIYVYTSWGGFTPSSETTTTIEVTTAQVPSLQSSSVTETTVSLSWTDYNVYSNLTYFQSYTVQMMPSSGSWSTVDTITAQSDTSYTESGLSPGTTYSFRIYDSIAVVGLASSFSSYSNTIQISTIKPLTVSISANTISVDIGQSVSINSNVQGGISPYTYQWYENGNPVNGATSPSFIFSSNSAGSYTVYLQVTDHSGSTQDSNDILFTVNPPLYVSISSSSSTVDVNSNLQFTSQVSGGVNPYNYQWYVNNNPVSGATSSSFSFAPKNAGTYSIYVSVTDASGMSTKSNTLTVTAFSGLTFTVTATSTNITNGSTSSLSVNPSGGSPPYSYQWFVNGAPVSGATSSTFIFKPSQTGNYSIYVEVKDSTGLVGDSKPLTIRVNKPSSAPSVTISLYDLLGIIGIVVIIVVVMLMFSRRNKQKNVNPPPPKAPNS